jgi:hypothetical protein
MAYIKAYSVPLRHPGGPVYKLALGVVILAAMAWAQENSAGCGADQAKFEVKREAQSHPTGAPEPGKALVYVFGDSELDNTAIRIGALNTRVGVDGEWVGAYGSKSYMYFSVAPGEHRLCTSQQSSLKSRRDNNASPLHSKPKKAGCITSGHNRVRRRWRQARRREYRMEGWNWQRSIRRRRSS